jgi:HSP20 family protein
LVWRRAVEVRRKDSRFEVLAAVAGVEPKDLDVRVTPEAVLTKADGDHKHAAQSGEVHLCEFSKGNGFRSIQLPERIDPETAKVAYHNGWLRLTVSLGKLRISKQTT